MFQQNVYYIKNNIVLTQVTGCSLWAMIIKIMWLFNCYHKAMILLYWSSKEKTLFSAILFLLLQQVCKTKRSHEYWYLRNKTTEVISAQKQKASYPSTTKKCTWSSHCCSTTTLKNELHILKRNESLLT